jgi:cardiolipin synthase
MASEPPGRRHSASEPDGGRDRVLTVPNALSVVRLALVPVFFYLLLVAHAYGWAVAILMFSGFSDWADGKIARLVPNQSSRLGALLDPAVDRIYMVATPIALGVAHIVPWWFVATLIGRDAVLAATLPVLRSRGLTALPVIYIGKGATFALMSGFPLVLLGQWDALWSRVILACGWAFLIWGIGLYLWSALLYLIQVGMVIRELPKAKGGSDEPLARREDGTDEPLARRAEGDGAGP